MKMTRSIEDQETDEPEVFVEESGVQGTESLLVLKNS